MKRGNRREGKVLRAAALDLVVLVALLLSHASVAGAFPEGMPVRTLKDAPKSAKDQLADSRIFFGHQSVGENIVEGLVGVTQADRGFGLTVIAAKDAPARSGGYFAHARIGKNGYPETKTDDFARILDTWKGPRPRVAFHKYCYADIHAQTDVSRIFDHYRRAMAALAQKYPDILFLHMTAPLMRFQQGWKARVKLFLGRQPDHYADNRQRERFNALLRQEYAGQGRLFDLAAVESTTPDGRREALTLGGETVIGLVPAYTTDGGHLNDAAQRRVAEALLLFLADFVASR
jgi:hypothetical protein